MFLFKKIVGPFFYPLSICLEILLLGLVLLWFTRKQRAGKIVVALGTFLLLLFSSDLFANFILRPLEYRYPPVTDVSPGESGTQNIFTSIKWIVVLSGGKISDPDIPAASQLLSASIIRLVESIQLHRELPGSKLILSGGGVLSSISEGKILAQVAQALGVNPQELVTETESKDTEDQARSIGKIVGQDRFILVTSASHMPRALALFRKQGMQPLPYPVGHLVIGRNVDLVSLFPSAENLYKCQIAAYEYLGWIWSKLRGQL